MDFSKTVIFLDVETTGNDISDRLIQLAYIATDSATPVNELFKPPIPISIESMAVHHITEKMVSEKPPFKNSPLWRDLEARFKRGDIVVAHNARFDMSMLQKEGLQINNIIDTLKIARALDPEGKIHSYKLQYLRYLLGIEIEATAHDALGDVLVLEQLTYRLLKKIMEQENLSQETALDHMISISAQPIRFRFFPFGKYKNKSIEDIAQNDRGYIEWLLKSKRQEAPLDTDWIFTLEKVLEM